METNEEHNANQVLIMFSKIYKEWQEFNNGTSPEEIAKRIRDLSSDVVDHFW